MLIHEIAATQTDFNIEDLFEIEDGVSGVSKKGTLENIIRKIISENAPSRIIPGQFTLSYTNTTTFGITAGKVLDDTFVSVLNLPSAFTKTLSAWAAGTGNGALDDGAVAANSSYDVYAIKNDTTGVGDYIMCLRGDDPIMPADHTYKKYVGCINTNAASQIHDFYQIGNMFRFRVQKDDFAYAAIANTDRNLLTISAPKLAIGIFSITMRYTGASAQHYLIVQASSETNAAASVTNHTLHCYVQNNACSAEQQILTDSSRQIAYRGSTTVVMRLVTLGWIDPMI